PRRGPDQPPRPRERAHGLRGERAPPAAGTHRVPADGPRRPPRDGRVDRLRGHVQRPHRLVRVRQRGERARQPDLAGDGLPLSAAGRRPLRRRVLVHVRSAGAARHHRRHDTAAPRVEGEWGESVPEESEWAGATTLGEITLAGQHLIAPGGTGLTARKTWLLLEDRI